jgi:Tol biopolymer transport system component
VSVTGQRSSLHVVDVASGRHRVAFARRGWSTQPSLSADGSRLVATTTAQVGRKPFGLQGVVLCDLRGSAAPRLMSTHARAPRGQRERADEGSSEHHH